MSNIFSSVQFHDSAIHRNDWEGLKENKKSIWIAGVFSDEMGMRRAERRSRALMGEQETSLSILQSPGPVTPCATLTVPAEICGTGAQRPNSSCFTFIAISELLSLGCQKKLCSTVSLINLLPTSLRKTRPANSFPATDCCVLSHPASCWQPCVYIGNQICRYFSWDMHKEYSPMSNLISM